MKPRTGLCLATLALVALTFANPALGQTLAKGQLKIPEFNGLADKASESVVVTLDSQILGLAAQLLNTNDPEEAAAKELVRSLTGIYVRNFTFDSDYDVPKADIEGVRKQLTAPGWSQMVG